MSVIYFSSQWRKNRNGLRITVSSIHSLNRLSYTVPPGRTIYPKNRLKKKNQRAPTLCTCHWWTKYFNKLILLSWSRVSDPPSAPQTARYYSVSQLAKIFETDICPSEYLIRLRCFGDRASVKPQNFHPPPAPGMPCRELWVGKSWLTLHRR